MATPVQITALRFGPVGTDGTSFSVPVNEVEVLTPVSTVEQAIIRFPMPNDVDVEVQSAMGFDIPVSNTPTLKGGGAIASDCIEGRTPPSEGEHEVRSYGNRLYGNRL